MRVLFADGGVATQMIHLPVKAPDGIALILCLKDTPGGYLTTILRLGTKPPANVRNLFPALRISPSNQLIPLTPGDVIFSVKSTGSSPVIDLDKKMDKVTALRPGHALLTMRFAGVENQTCVVVMSDPAVVDPSNCEELR